MNATSLTQGFPGSSAGKESACSAGDSGLIPGLGRSPGEGKGCTIHCSCLENSMDCIVSGATKSSTRLSNFHFHCYVLARTEVSYGKQNSLHVAHKPSPFSSGKTWRDRSRYASPKSQIWPRNPCQPVTLALNHKQLTEVSIQMEISEILLIHIPGGNSLTIQSI